MVRISLFIFLFGQLSFSALAQNEPVQHNYSSREDVQLSESELIANLKKTPEAFEPNYNLALYYYNQAVNEIESLNYEDPNIQAQQQKTEELFRKALDPALMAFRRNQTHQDVLRMLSGIYFGLGDERMNTYYESLLQK